ncbi:DNA adenine methylase [Paenarthrobacter sp. NPDC018779]|uniref:DNA adenine methylase n=1 Tax=Paenarthrobacter sp. NPDC018779 TaxID=3364375 RepID=UPI0037C55774
MGGKAALLRGELGEIVLREAVTAERFVDLFSGSGSVSHFVAESLEVPVLSVDLQHYAAVLAESVTGRTAPTSDAWVKGDWVNQARKAVSDDQAYLSLECDVEQLEKGSVERSREKCVQVRPDLFITKHYGGHYFSPQQAFELDWLYRTLPQGGQDRILALAALIQTASSGAAAPGHTAQPFQPTSNLLPYIRKAWSRDILAECQVNLSNLASRHARVKGRVLTQSAESVASNLGSGDLVFCDPPYSAVQYSRFYHVLEGISKGGWPAVFGAGRSPDKPLRKSSSFSLKSESSSAMKALLKVLREAECRVIVTFPDAAASNGLSGDDIVAMSLHEWSSSVTYVTSTHSTLGGSSAVGGRGGRRQLKEAVIYLEPR